MKYSRDLSTPLAKSRMDNSDRDKSRKQKKKEDKKKNKSVIKNIAGALPIIGGLAAGLIISGKKNK
jgi:lipid-binding SYLF domain-containing protein